MGLTDAELRHLRSHREPGNRLRAARVIAGLTQVAVAQAVGVSQSAISDLERMRYSATSVETAHRFSKFFGCAIEDLFPAQQQAVAS
jgi:DNA-binding XRE family transcriptional regulator